MDNKSSKLEYFVICILLMAVVATGALYMLHKRDNKVSNLNKDNKEVETDKKEPDKKDPVVNNTDLDFDFLRFDYNNNNVFYSPLSIREALFLVQEGADGNTLEQLNNVLNRYKHYSVKNVDKKIGISNAIFIKDEFKDNVLDSYINKLVNDYKSDVFFDDMSSPDKVNNYVKEKTFDMIPKLFEDISTSRVVLVNALAIDLDWKYKFDAANTRDSEFNNGNKLNVPTMYDTFDHISDIRYYKSDDLTILSLPLREVEGTNLEYIVVMPNDLDSLVKSVNDTSFKDSLDNLKSGKDVSLAISMPIYKNDFDLNFKSDLEKLGLTDMFKSDAANFRKMASVDLFINDAKHKAHIEVSEDGVKAAAVTGFAFTEGAAFQEEKPIVININKPHMVVIRDKDTEDIWFVGTVFNPLGE